MLGEVRGKLVEVIRQLDLTPQRPKGLCDGATTLHGYKSSDRTPGALDDDLLTALCEVYEP